jgi:hypothetical protein
MDKQAQEAWVAFLKCDLTQAPSADYMTGVEDLPVQERDFEGAKPASPNAAERQRRQKAVNFARASMGLEGFTLSDEDEARTRRFINGEIDLDEFVSYRIDRDLQGTGIATD